MIIVKFSADMYSSQLLKLQIIIRKFLFIMYSNYIYIYHHPDNAGTCMYSSQEHGYKMFPMYYETDFKNFSSRCPSLDLPVIYFGEFCVPFENFSLIWRVLHHFRWRVANLELCGIHGTQGHWAINKPQLLPHAI